MSTAGDINGRLRLTLEVIAKIRELCGDDFIIDVRISGDEYSEGGLTLNDMIYVSKQLEKTGVDFIHGFRRKYNQERKFHACTWYITGTACTRK